MKVPSARHARIAQAGDVGGIGIDAALARVWKRVLGAAIERRCLAPPLQPLQACAQGRRRMWDG